MHSMEKVIYLRYEAKSFLEMDWFILCTTMLAQDMKIRLYRITVIYTGAQQQENWIPLRYSYVYYIYNIWCKKKKNFRLEWTWNSSQNKTLQSK